ncbi:MaoC family dehydratase [Pseudorhodoferax sp. Leaf267]|uniref:MaoC family dehydratase n=1 Tax=Pseudorhodoferax sp. Leaf267 TaxID=1736316 RepID=UPI0006F62714|nr:MaoC family dehydratase [Pseudorhodoferax sp. Leaf267]KQP15148.1 3-alpha,7-alpha,12-alpha-trihydroxy-5-beta-cholest-24-enoyl-CoA hydratase [Pseudorhodoferax sp. Leaf267]
MIDYHKLKAWHFPVIEHTYTADDSMRYALALGLGEDPMDLRQLQYVNDTIAGTPLALPSMAVVLGFPGSWMQDPASGIDFTRIVHGEEDLVLHQPLPAAGTVLATHRIVSIVDKGEGRGATITYDKELHDKADGTLLATVRHTTFARGNGGFSARDGVTDASPPAPPKPPTGTPDQVLEIRTSPQMALLYRLLADRNPLHSEPAVAQAAGFERPILHGLGTYGIACRALLSAWCGDRPERLQRLFARFSAPVFPGETIRMEMYAGAGLGDIAFRAIAVERGVTVLDAGRARIAA